MPAPEFLIKAERKKLRELRAIASSLDSPNLGEMYTAAGKLMTLQCGKSLLPKAMSLLDKGDETLRRLVYRSAGRNVYGKYIPELFEWMKRINPAEREQVLQVVEESFRTIGSPFSRQEVDAWINVLSNIGHEHQATVFGIMALLGDAGFKWAKKRIKNNIETISIGTIAKLGEFPPNVRTKLVRVAIGEATKRKPDLLPYLCEITDKSSLKYLRSFLESGNWQDRIHVARAIGRVGITSSKGIVMDIVADPDWRVKQELIESIDISRSNLSNVMKILSYMVADSHSRVRGQADRTILLLGCEPCKDMDLETQRVKLEKQFRTQLLRAAPKNRDIDSRWLGIEIDDHPIPILNESSDEPAGISLIDISSKTTEEKAVESPKSDLLAALLKAKEKAVLKEPIIPDVVEEVIVDDIEMSLPATEKFMQVLKKLSGKSGRGVSLDRIKREASSLEMSEEEVDEALGQLEKDGIVYRSSRGTIKRVDIEL